MHPSRPQPLRSLRALIRRVRRRATVRDRWHSVSSTREYERCPRRYRFAYLDRRPEDRPVPPTWRFGSVVHAGLEAAYRLAMADPSRPRTDLLQAATVAVDTHWDHYGMSDDGAYRDRAIWLTTRALAKDIIDVRDARILGVEMRFRDTSDERTRIAGIADLVLERPDGTLEIVDHKVTSHWAGPEDLREDLQLNLYGDLARREWPSHRRIVATHHYPTGPGKVSVELAPSLMAGAHQHVRETAALIRADPAFAPTPSAACDHCPWLPSCRAGMRYLAAGAANRRAVGGTALLTSVTSPPEGAIREHRHGW